ncbi:cell wall-active antibiotics response protein LiaF [Paenibacillus polygoni]|uniref:Cell wall-active antibiotics response protein LiaF n=1 Tax=Paenibacillus polygoni TaxID=3050112 RepID=A0ABY8X622_9BACL|nr:cell wall-active antibiotics response protein LiaF [Paenibacillus polygoni]WIV20488.1 cell wall-active antibiotics response protein LiaF [Paenibacillus polygoni]
MANRFIGAVLLIGIGLLVLLHILNGGDFSLSYLISTYWPVIFLYLGFSSLKDKNWIGGLILLYLGAHFLSNNLGYSYFSFRALFRYAVPIGLIGGGLYVLLSPRRRDRKHDQRTKEDEEYVVPPSPPVEPSPLYSDFDKQFEQKFGSAKVDDDNKKYEQARQQSHYGNNDNNDVHFHDENEKINKSTFIGDIRLGDDYYELKPTNISQFIGDTVIDLTKAQIPYGETRIHISSFIGDIKVFAPRDMEIGIMVNSNSFIGDMDVLSNSKQGFMSNAVAETPGYREAGKKVRIIISVFIGDVKVNSVG